MSFKTASAILRGRWLIDKSWAQEHLPLVLKMAKGETVDFGLKKDESTAAKVLSNKTASVYNVGYYTDLGRLPSGAIAMLDIIGPVTKYGDMCSYGSIDHEQTLNRLANAPNVSAIILNIDSPGGEAAGTGSLAQTIKTVSNKKPVVALINDGIAASAAMWITSAASEIYATQKTDMLGSIGAYTTIADWNAYIESQGLPVRDIYAPQSTDKNFDYKEALKDPPNDKPIEENLRVLVNEFINTIQANRGSKLTSSDWQTGKMYYAKDALKIGLIDGIKSFDQVIRRVNTLISQTQNSNSNTMAFDKTLSAAKAESFDVVDGGFLLEESHLTNLENALVLAAANTESITQLTNQVAEKEAALTASAGTIKAHEDKIAALETENAALGKKDAGKASGAGGEEDPNKNSKDPWAKYRTSVDDQADSYRKIINS